MDEKDRKKDLLQKAKLMGLTVSPNSSVDTLQEKINVALGSPVQEPETKKPSVRNYHKEQMRLVRVRIQHLDSSDEYKGMQGEYFSVANSVIGRVGKYIPFNSDSYHIPYCLYKSLKDRTYTKKVVLNPGTSNQRVTYTEAPRFHLEVLPNLTKDELEDIKQRQLSQNSVDNT